MGPGTSKLTVWITVALVILITLPRQMYGGPVSFAACVAQAAGPVCAAAAATATAACSATAFLPPAFCACVAAASGTACAGAIAICVGTFFAPTP